MLDCIQEKINTWDWKAQTIGSVKTGEQGIPVSNLINRINNGYYKTKDIKLNIENLNLATYSFNCPNIAEFMVHFKLTENADLKYPIIINNVGQIVDGRHRLCKAILQGKKTIKAIVVLDSEIY